MGGAALLWGCIQTEAWAQQHARRTPVEPCSSHMPEPGPQTALRRHFPCLSTWQRCRPHRCCVGQPEVLLHRQPGSHKGEAVVAVLHARATGGQSQWLLARAGRQSTACCAARPWQRQQHGSAPNARTRRGAAARDALPLPDAPRAPPPPACSPAAALGTGLRAPQGRARRTAPWPPALVPCWGAWWPGGRAAAPEAAAPPPPQTALPAAVVVVVVGWGGGPGRGARAVGRAQSLGGRGAGGGPLAT